MTFDELNQHDIDNVFYDGCGEFAITAILSDTTTVKLRRQEPEEFGEVEHRLYRIRSSEASRVSEGEQIMIGSEVCVVLALEPILESNGLEWLITLESKDSIGE